MSVASTGFLDEILNRILANFS